MYNGKFIEVDKRPSFTSHLSGTNRVPAVQEDMRYGLKFFILRLSSLSSLKVLITQPAPIDLNCIVRLINKARV